MFTDDRVEGEDHRNVAVNTCVSLGRTEMSPYTNTPSGGSSGETKLFNWDMRGRNSEPPGAKEEGAIIIKRGHQVVQGFQATFAHLWLRTGGPWNHYPNSLKPVSPDS